MFGIGEILYHVFHIKTEITRKFSHIVAGFIALLFPFLLSSHYSVLLLIVVFMLLLIITKRLNLLKSIHSIERKSFGSYLFPLSVYYCFILYSIHDHYIFYFQPICILAICDACAAFAGKKWPYGRYNNSIHSKTLVGSAMFFTAAFVVTVSLFLSLTNMEFIVVMAVSVMISMVSTVIEAISYKGMDNLTIPIGVGLILLLCNDPASDLLAINVGR